MRRQIHCFWLLFALAASWAEAFVPALSQPEMATSQAEVYPIALQYRTDLQTNLETAPPVTITLPVVDFLTDSSFNSLAARHQTMPHVFSSADICYTLMSMQW